MGSSRLWIIQILCILETRFFNREMYFLRWDTHLYMSLFPSACQSVAHHISGNVHHLIIILVHFCKMMILPLFFFIVFSEFKFFRLLAFKVGKTAKNSQNEKWQLHMLWAICQEQYSIWWWFLVHLFLGLLDAWCYLQNFCNFF